jgi:hypothetical protein
LAVAAGVRRRVPGLVGGVPPAAGTQAVLYYEDAPVLMAIVKVSLGWPLTVACRRRLAAVRKAVRSNLAGAAGR